MTDAKDLRTTPAPLDVNMLRVVGIGTALWGLALLALLPWWGWLDRTGRLHWLLICAVGVALGFFGLWVCQRRLRRAAAPPAAS